MVEINLLPWRDYLKSKKQNKKIGELVFALLFASLLLGCLHFILLFQLKAVKASLSRTESGLAKVNKSLDEVRILYQELDYQRLPDLDLNTLLNRQRQILAFLRKLAEWMPGEMYLSRLDFEDKAWMFEGVALALADVLLLSDRLKNKVKSRGLEGVLKKEKFLNIKQKNALFYYQFRFEPGL